MRLALRSFVASLTVALALSGCSQQGPRIRVTVELHGFSRGCVRVLAGPPGAADPLASEIQLDPAQARTQVSVAVFPKPEWGQSVELTAEARESTCAGTLATVDRRTVSLAASGATEASLTLSADDRDGDGFFARPSGTDCDDGDPAVHPGVPDPCDGRDNDCDGLIDEDFQVDVPCDAGDCAGATLRCLADGGIACQATAHQDVDGDRHGATAGPTFTGACLPPDSGWVYDATDCDDQDPFTYQGAPEICDGRDNDCSGTADEGATCPPDAGWYAKSDGLHDFRALASSGAAKAVAAGTLGAMVVVQPTAPAYTDHTADCGSPNWNAVWFDPVQDMIYLAGDSGDAEIHPRAASTCVGGTYGHFDTARDNVRGLWGFHGGVIELTGLDIFVVMDTGQTVVWDGAIPGDDHSLGVVSAQLRAVHGATEARVFAVGTDTSLQEPRIFRYNLPDGGWTDQNVQSLPGVVRAPLNAVWMASDALGYAVGDQHSILAWDGNAWTPKPGPQTGNGSLRGVVAWGPGSLYVADDQIHRFDGTSWTTLSPGVGVQLFAIGGSSPADLWAVGPGGWIAHWPKVPW